MPYISQDRRYAFDTGSQPEDGSITAGDFNYMVSALVDGMLEKYGVSYSALNSLIGALECAKLELYRRIAAPYEDQKRAENGDVYTVTPRT